MRATVSAPWTWIPSSPALCTRLKRTTRWFAPPTTATSMPSLGETALRISIHSTVTKLSESWTPSTLALLPPMSMTTPFPRMPRWRLPGSAVRVMVWLASVVEPSIRSVSLKTLSL